MELYWWSIEVLDGSPASARSWRDAHEAALTEAAITNGAYDWDWQQHTWGVLFEIAFASDERWQAFRVLPVVRAVLDAVPIAGAGAAPLPEEDPPPLRAVEEGQPPSGPAWIAA